MPLLGSTHGLDICASIVIMLAILMIGFLWRPSLFIRSSHCVQKKIRTRCVSGSIVVVGAANYRLLFEVLNTKNSGRPFWMPFAAE